MDVFVLAGQSNMSGRGGVEDEEWDGIIPESCKHDVGTVLRFSAMDEWEEAWEPLHVDIDSSKTCGIGPGLTFAAEIIRRKQESKASLIGLIPCAIGGTSISEWRREGPLYQSMIRRTRLSLNGGGILRALLWYQGESDCSSMVLAETYTERFEELVKNLRTDLEHPMLPVIQVGIWAQSLSTMKYLNRVRDAQKAVRLPGVFFIDAIGSELQEDKVHLTTDAQLRLGLRLAECYISEVMQIIF